MIMERNQRKLIIYYSEFHPNWNHQINVNVLNLK